MRNLFPPTLPGKHEYRFSSSWDGDGEVSSGDNCTLWRFGSAGQPFLGSIYRFGRLPPFRLSDLDDRPRVAVNVVKRWPYAAFDVTEDDQRIGRIRELSLLFTKYAIEFDGSPPIIVRLPLFTVHFGGQSSCGAEIRIRMWSHQVWFALVDEEINGPRIVAAIAFLHRERLRHG